MNPAPTPEREPRPDTAAGGPPPLRLPSSPYPGLRPFLDHEDMLMHGRQTQIADVVRRLGRQQRPAADAGAGAPPPLTRFVAVIGGSGSGKSSLMRAGVVPYLRQFGIPEAGDLWESVVATPGTNFQPDADGLVRESPITRLAAKFEQVLRGGHSAQRCDALVQMLRRDGGLGRMVDEFAPQLALPTGVKPEDACVLIVIDQFEELFHKTNAESADAKALIERVIDHFHESRQGQGSRRCFLAITMRSEHLNDCAGFLGLPEAINSGGYLVSRLGEAQVREVIERPAQRYLRLRQRERQQLARRLPPDEIVRLPELPRAVAFEDGVVDQLVEAAAKIHHDPDHLPLLQHALARTWSAACLRERLQDSDVPQQILLADLWRAGQADVDPPAPPAKDGNLLRLSLDSWAEHTLHRHARAEDREAVLDLMRRLAYKDLRTGNYNQQRLYVARHPLGETALKALLQGRWIDDVDYLHWDAEDPQRVTLKVSHESFIRGWKRLRKLADHEALRLDRFTQLLEATQIWVQHSRPATELLEQRMLDRMGEVQIEAALGPPGAAHDQDPETETWLDWQRWLGQLPRGELLKSVSRAEARDYLRCSREALAARVQAEQTQREVQREVAIKAREDAAKAQAEARTLKVRRQTRRLSYVILVVTSLAAAFAGVVMVPVTTRAQHYFNAARLANQVSPDRVQAQIGSKSADLRKLIAAAAEFEQASHPQAEIDGWTAMTAPLADRVLTWPGLNRLNLATLLPDAAAAFEGPVNRQLLQLMAQSLWLAAADTTPPGKGLAAGTMREMYCEDDYGGLFGTVTTEGGARATATERRGVLVSDDVPTSADSRQRQDAGGAGKVARQTLNRRVFSVQVSSGPATPDRLDGCRLGSQLLERPFVADQPASKPAVMLDATLSHMFLSTPSDEPGAQGSAETLEVMRLLWPERGSAGSTVVDGPFAVVTDDAQATTDLRRQVTSKDNLPRPGQTAWRTASGRAWQVGDRRWQLVTPSGHAVAPPRDQLQALPAVPDGHECLDISRRMQADYKAYAAQYEPQGAATEPLDLTTLAADGYCLILERSHRHAPVKGKPEERQTLRDQINLQVFRAPTAGDRDGQNRLVRTNLVSRLDFGRVRHAENDWWTGKAGSAWSGWLILERPATDASRPPFAGMSWSTSALRRQAEALYTSHEAAVKAESRPASAGPRNGRPNPGG